MDYRIDWSPEAVEDVEAIAEYIARDSEMYAKSLVSTILDSVKHLSSFPRIGRRVPEIADESIRELFVYNYRLIYRILDDRILIVAVIHGKRLLESISQRFSA
jgi:toxin ParE1/3/4